MLQDSEESSSEQEIHGELEGFNDLCISTAIVPLYQNRMVLLKIADKFLRVSSGNKPLISRKTLNLNVPVNESKSDRLLDPRLVHQKTANPRQLALSYKDYTFFADESATIMESWYRNTKAFFNIRFGVDRDTESDSTTSKKMEYLVCNRLPHNKYEPMYSRPEVLFGLWWRLTAVGGNKYVCESLSCPGYCLTRGQFGLGVTGPLTSKDRARINQGRWDPDRTLTIITLPDFGVWQPMVWVL